jgi:hypothetical protein
MAANRLLHKDGGQASTLSMLRASGNRRFVFQFAVHNACVSSATYMFPLWVADWLAWTARDVGLVFGIQGGIMVLLQGGAMGAMVRVMGEWGLLRAAVGMFLGGFLLAASASTMPAMVASMFLSMSGATLCMPLLNTLITERTPATHRGRVLGTTAAASSWGRVFGPLVSGLGLGYIGYSATWGIWSLVLVWYLVWVFRESSRAV